MSNFVSTKIINLGSCAFRQWRATHSHCSKIHGYNLKAKIWFACSHLDDKNWAVDFGGLKEIRKELEGWFDHTLCVASDEPHLETFRLLHEQGVIDLRILDQGVGCERFAEFVFKLVTERIEAASHGRCWVSQVEVFEHENNSALYRRGNFIAAVDIPSDVREDDLEDLYEEHYQVTTGPEQDGVFTRVEKIGTPASVGNQVTTGLGNMFAGTSWG